MNRFPTAVAVAAPATPQRDPRANPFIELLATGLVRVIATSVANCANPSESAATSLDFSVDPRLSGPTGTPSESGEAGDVEM